MSTHEAAAKELLIADAHDAHPPVPRSTCMAPLALKTALTIRVTVVQLTGPPAKTTSRGQKPRFKASRKSLVTRNTTVL